MRLSFGEGWAVATARQPDPRPVQTSTLAAHAFNQPLNFTDTSNLTNINNMLYFVEALNQPLNFDTSSVTDMSNMFSDAIEFNQPLDFSTSSVTDMGGVFCNAVKFNQPLNFNTSSVKTTFSITTFSISTFSITIVVYPKHPKHGFRSCHTGRVTLTAPDLYVRSYASHALDRVTPLPLAI